MVAPDKLQQLLVRNWLEENEEVDEHQAGNTLLGTILLLALPLLLQNDLHAF